MGVLVGSLFAICVVYVLWAAFVIGSLRWLGAEFLAKRFEFRVYTDAFEPHKETIEEYRAREELRRNGDWLVPTVMAFPIVVLSLFIVFAAYQWLSR